MKNGKLAVLALGLVAVLLSAVACASTTATPSDAAASGTSGGSNSDGVAEQAALLSSDFGTLAAFAAASGSQQAGIWVSGTGIATLEPDLVVLSLGVEAQAPTVSEATGQAARAMDAIFAALEARGIEDKDIRTTYYGVQPEYSYPRDGQPVLAGYRVSNQASVKVRDLDSVGVIIDEVAAAGGDNTRINGISFTVEDATLARTQAREAAVKDAVARAEQFAELTGVTLGKLMYISESGVTYPERYVDAKYGLVEGGAAAPTTPISGGELDVTVSVQAVFGIE